MPDTSAPAISAELRIIARAYKGENLTLDDYELPKPETRVTLLDDLDHYFDASLDSKSGKPDLRRPFRDCLGTEGNPEFIRIFYQRDSHIPPSTPVFEESGNGDDEIADKPSVLHTEPNENAWGQMYIHLGSIELHNIFGNKTYDDVTAKMEDIDILQIIADTPGMKGEDYEKLQSFIDRAARDDLAFTIRYGTETYVPADTIVLRQVDTLGDECGAARVWLEGSYYYREDPQAPGQMQDAELLEFDCTSLFMGKVAGRDFIENTMQAGLYNPARANGEPLLPWHNLVDPFNNAHEEEWLAVLYAARHYGEEGWEFIARSVLDEMDIPPVFPDELVDNFHRRLDSAEQITARPGKGPHQRGPGDAPGESLHK